jgi:polyisoprenoid-binding protein YceI
MFRIALAGLVAALVGSAGIAADTYKLSGENTTIEFTGTKKDGKHTGGFKKCTGTVTHDKDWAIEITIDTESLFSDDEKLTGHLKGGDFFNCKDQPTATFKTTKIEKTDKGYTVTGKLTLLGKEKEISFPAEITTGETFGLKAEFKIDRTDYGMTYGEGKIDKEVALKVAVAAKK